jgi:hypothetical protein
MLGKVCREGDEDGKLLSVQCWGVDSLEVGGMGGHGRWWFGKQICKVETEIVKGN